MEIFQVGPLYHRRFTGSISKSSMFALRTTSVVHQSHLTGENRSDNSYLLEESVIYTPKESAKDRIAQETKLWRQQQFELLWKSANPQFSNSFPIALRVCKQLEVPAETNRGISSQELRTSGDAGGTLLLFYVIN
ncbi:uncharacterized protein LOC134219481 [Armigeres subalbatus]|uniref:uncharacterized protein LOC134219481 n=1 Tax=Armigeres subalbatus TaxID=124917 RepID=UPI002ED54181